MAESSLLRGEVACIQDVIAKIFDGGRILLASLNEGRCFE